MAAIDVGAPAIDRSSSIAQGYTVILKDNPANDTGAITSVEMWFATNGVNVEVATFFVVSGDNLSTRDTETIGAVTAGSKQTFSGLDMAVETGDYLGYYCTGGALDFDAAGGAGDWYKAGDQIPCTNVAFIGETTNIMSLYGTGETPPVGWTGKIAGVTDPAKIAEVAVANIASVKGVA